MNDYSDLILMMGAIVLFMMLGLQANRFMLTNSSTTAQSEIEYYALTVSHDIIEDIRVITDEGSFHSYLSNFPSTVDYQVRRSDLQTIPFHVTVDTMPLHDAHATFEDATNINSFHITVTVSSEFLNQGSGGSVSLSTAKSFLII